MVPEEGAPAEPTSDSNPPKAAAEEPAFAENEKDYTEDKKGTDRAFSSKCGVKMNARDSTLNAFVDGEGCIIGCIPADGFESLFTQVRASHGIKKGRYYFEAQVIDAASSQPVEFRIGVSSSNAPWVGGVGSESMCFDHKCQLRTNGEIDTNMTAKQWKNEDVIGILLNLDETMVNKNTLSLFINGTRASDPHPLPKSMHKKALYPHVALRGCTMGLNFSMMKVPLSFKVRTLAEALKADIEESELARQQAKGKTPRLIFPIGLDPDSFVAEFVKNNDEKKFIVVSKNYLDEWAAFSDWTKKSERAYGIPILDTPSLLAPYCRIRRIDTIWGLSTNDRSTLFAGVREQHLTWFPGFHKIAHVIGVGNAWKNTTAQLCPKFANACLPTKDEGFNEIKYEIPQKQLSEDLDLWKRHMQKHSKVENFKVGETFKERHAAWIKFAREKRKTKEGKKLSEEDWMIADLRAELLNVIHAFKEDVNDPARPVFPTSLANHYFRQYLEPRTINARKFTCPSIEELIRIHCTNCVAVEDGFMVAKQPLENMNEKIFDLVKAERERRLIRVESGDELAEFNFRAPYRPASEPKQAGPMQHTYKGHGKGYFGKNKRRYHHQYHHHDLTDAPDAQRVRVS